MTSTDFERLFEGLYSATHVVILLDPTWQTIYHTQPAQAESSTAALRSQLLAGKPLTGADGEYYYFLTRNEGTGLSLILQQPKTFSSQVMDTFYTVSILMGLMCLLLCLWCAWLLSRHLSQPVHQLDEAMGEIKKGNLEIHMETDREDELGRLTESFNRMTEEYRQNLVRSVARQRELNETQLRMMQAQLNPHFLYNTLDSMKWLGVTHHVPQVATLATDLAVILRAGISGSEFITLEDELELVDRYIDIQSLRFEDRFTCEIDVPENKLKIRLRFVKSIKNTNICEKLYTKWIDYDTIKDTLQVRTRRPGDYISAAGGRKKLKDYFIDEKIPRSERDRIPLLADGSHILWIIGYRLSDGCKIGEETKRVLEIDAEFPGAYI